MGKKQMKPSDIFGKKLVAYSPGRYYAILSRNNSLESPFGYWMVITGATSSIVEYDSYYVDLDGVVRQSKCNKECSFESVVNEIANGHLRIVS